MMLLNTATIVCIGLMIGAEFAVSAFINPVIWKLEDGAQMQAVRLFATKLGFVMPIWYGLGFLLLLTETFISRHDPHVAMLAAASGIWALVIVMSLLVLVPINNRLAGSETAVVTETAQRDQRKWDTLHRVRVAALTTAMVMLLTSIR
jgi:Domain of unknown function (DUF1772)